MKLKHKILISILISTVITNAVIAQKRPLREKLSAPQTINVSLSKSEVLTVIKEELEKVDLKNEVKIRERVQNEVDRSFGWTIGLIQILLGVLTALPIFASVFLILLRNSIKNQIIEEAKNQIKEKLDIEIKAALEEFHKKINLEKSDLLKKYTQNMEDLYAEASKMKDLIIKKLDHLVSDPSQKEFIHESTNPEVLAEVQELTALLNKIQGKYPKIILTPQDYAKKGDALVFENFYEEALTCYETAIELQDNYYDAWLSKGVVLCRLKRFEEALLAFDKVIQLNPTNYLAWYNKGSALRDLKKHEESLKAFKLSSSLFPVNYLSFLNEGLVLKQLKRFEEALAAFEKVIEIKSDCYKAWFEKACIHSLNGNNKLAIQSLKKSIEISENCRQMARVEPDLDNIRNDPDFKILIK
jgi:tetratricopeptide (TPR) repeat protein